MKFKKSIWIGLACAVALNHSLVAQKLEPVFEEGQEVTTSVEIQQIYNLTEVAKTAVDFERIADRSEKLLAKTIFEKDKKYLTSLIGWSRNRMAQAYVKNSASMKEMGLAEQADQELAKAIEQFDLVIKEHPQIWRAWMGRAKIHAEACEYEQALEKFVEVTRRKRDQYAAWFNSAELASQLGQHEKAIECYSRMIGQDASDVQARTGRAHSLLMTNEFQAAIEDYKTVVILQVNDEVALCNLGDAYIKAEQWQEAATAFETASKLPKATLGLERFASLLCSCPDETLVDTDRAVKAANLAIENGEATPRFLRTLSAAYQANGQTDLAEEIKLRAEKMSSGQARHANLTDRQTK